MVCPTHVNPGASLVMLWFLGEVAVVAIEVGPAVHQRQLVGVGNNPSELGDLPRPGPARPSRPARRPETASPIAPKARRHVRLGVDTSCARRTAPALRTVPLVRPTDSPVARRDDTQVAGCRPARVHAERPTRTGRSASPQIRTRLPARDRTATLPAVRVQGQPLPARSFLVTPRWRGLSRDRKA
jgi:hypothetical protein